jgi:hypothetical protein
MISATIIRAMVVMEAVRAPETSVDFYQTTRRATSQVIVIFVLFLYIFMVYLMTLPVAQTL